MLGVLAPDATGAQILDPTPDVQFVFDPSSGTPSPEVLEALTAERAASIGRALMILGDAAPRETTVSFHAYSSAVLKGMATRDGRWAHLDPGAETLHVVVDGDFRGDRLGLEASLLFSRALGPPSLPILETGVATFHSTEWGGQGFEYWAARLHSAGLVPPLSTILSPQWTEEESSFLVEPVAGALVAHLLSRWSRTGFVERYDSWRPDDRDIEAMEAGWAYHLDSLLSRHQAAIEVALAESRARNLRGFPQLRGVNYAHEGYRRYDGYLSERSDLSLARLAAIGANAAAVLPYAFMPSPNEPVPLRAPTRFGTETDEAVIQAIRAARQEGLTVLLKPHLWLRDSWPGEIEMRSPRDWDRFFEYYERWIFHYALLAEIHGVPLFSVGVELSKATMGHERRWEELVGQVRGIYSGAIVYAANWGEEFENLEFWSVFDYLGVDAYYPLSDDPEASDAELRRGANAMLDRIETLQRRHRKPVLFTEIGFASARGSWVRPWEGHLVEQPSGTDQLRSYRAVIGAMQGREWISGVFWWEWPSDLRRAVPDRRGFMPAGKPAEALLSQWFRGSSKAPDAAF